VGLQETAKNSITRVDDQLPSILTFRNNQLSLSRY
jgi:hypothetical protein